MNDALTGGPCENTDRELWRERPGDYYADSIHVTESGGIGINRGGSVYVKPIREWHKLAGGSLSIRDNMNDAPGAVKCLCCQKIGNVETANERHFGSDKLYCGNCGCVWNEAFRLPAQAPAPEQVDLEKERREFEKIYPTPHPASNHHGPGVQQWYARLDGWLARARKRS